MASFHGYLLIILFVFTSFTVSPFVSLQDLLQMYGLPQGMFPTNVKKFSLDENNVLEVQLLRPCLTKFESVVYFERIVRANLSKGKLWGIEGLSNKELFIWLPVKGIIVNYPNAGLALIDITMANKTVSLSVFARPPTCQPEGENSSQVLSLKAGKKSAEFAFGFHKINAALSNFLKYIY